MTSILQFMVQQQQLLVLKLWLFVRVLGVMENQWEEEAWKGRKEAWKGREEAREEVGLAIKFMDTATALRLAIDGPERCPHCFCSPCVVTLPPTFLVGSAPPNLRNAHKIYPLYRKFWRVCRDIGVWKHREGPKNLSG